MIQRGLLQQRHVGNSLFCHPSFSDPLARNLLAHAAILEKKERLKRPNERNLDREVERLALEEPSLLTALLTKKGLLLVIAEEQAKRRILRKTSILNISFSTPEELRKELLNDIAPLRDAIILHSYEQLLLILHPIHEQLLLNHSRLFRGDGR